MGPNPRSPFQIPVGTYPFSPVDPDLDTDCVHMVYIYTQGYQLKYHLSDTSCEGNKGVICII